MNPFVQGWSTAHLSPQVQALPTWSTQPSLHGALPYPHHLPARTPPPADSFATYTVVPSGSPRSHSILNSVVLGPDSRTHFHISSDDAATVVEAAGRRRVAVITWAGAHPTLAIDDLGWTLRTSQWLYLSSDRA